MPQLPPPFPEKGKFRMIYRALNMLRDYCKSLTPSQSIDIETNHTAIGVSRNARPGAKAGTTEGPPRWG